ncbi:MAG: DUF4332 domain-containing protein [Gudongella sp.]|jgi:predicted flap endonuclease-1-like 5' DNA nuclease|nr:DUF4332 domain-containing protein [Gudongella sp.]
MAKIDAIEGVGAAYAAKLIEAGIDKTEKLLDAGATKKGRIKLAEETGISEKLILTWVNHCDLYRVKGIGPQYAEILEAAGVDSVPELATRRADNLLNKMKEVNEQKKLVRGLPAQKQVENWILRAKDLPKVVTH